MRIKSTLIGGAAWSVLAIALAAPAAAGQQAAGSTPEPLPPVVLAQASPQDEASDQDRALTPETEREDEAEEDIRPGDIIVTGTRIVRPNATSNAPVTVIDEEELKWRGLTHLEEALNQLPQVTPTLGNLNSSDRAGPAGINLRRLGPGRTLTLINGQRVFNDINIIPGALIERVDILTGGAGAVYGSDAIAGVINYILKQDYSGISIEAEGSIFQHTNDAEEKRQLLADAGYPLPKKNLLDGEQGFINIAAGQNFADGRGNIGVYAGYRKTTDLSFSQFDNAACVFVTRSATGTQPDDNSTRACTQRSFNPYGQFDFTRDGVRQILTLAKDGSASFRPYDESDIQRVPFDVQKIYRDDQRYNVGGTASYELTDSIQWFASLMYSKYDTAGDALGVDQYGDSIPINCDNPFLSAQQATTLCGTAAGDPTQSQQTFISFNVPDSRFAFTFGNEYRRIATNVQGKLTDEINFNVGYSNALFKEGNDQRGYYDAVRFRNSVQVRNVNGIPTCIATINDPNVQCEPLNVFAFGAASQAARDFIIGQAGQTNNTQRQSIYNATVSGTLGEIGLTSPFATESVGFAVTGEYREYEYSTVSTGYNLLFNTNYDGKVDIKEAAFELDVPLVQDKPFFHNLSVNGGYRVGEYSSYAKTVHTWKGELTWSPIPDFRFRGSINRSIRVALQEAFSPTVPRQEYIFDPCSPPGAGATIERLSFEQCAATGVTREQYDALTNFVGCFSNGFCPVTILRGGNPDLAPEKGTSYTAGIVVQPRALPGFFASVDYYRIKVDGYFRVVDPYVAFDLCLGGQTFFCNIYVRDPATGQLTGNGYAEGRSANAGYQSNRGFDVDVRYRFDLGGGDDGKGWGGLEVGYLANFLSSIEIQDFPGTTPYDCVGYWGFLCSAPNPSYRHNARVTWMTPFANAAITLNWRHSSAVEISKLSDNPILQSRPSPFNTDVYPLDSKLPAADYFDLGIALPIARELNVRFSVQNLFDREPRITDAEIAGTGVNTLPGMYDPVGRTLRLGISARFF